MFDKMPYYGQVLLMCGLALGIIGLAYFFVPDISSQKAEIEKLEISLQDKRNQIQEGQAIEARLPEFEREIENLERKLDDVAQILPSGPETGDLLRWIKNLGDQSNLELKSFDPGARQPVEFYEEFPIRMEVSGRYHDLGIFLDRVSKYQRIINVDNLAIKSARANDGKTIAADFTAVTFVYDENGANPAAGSAQ